MKNNGKSLRGQPLEVPEGGLWLSLAALLFAPERKAIMTGDFSSYCPELQQFAITSENQMLVLPLPRVVCVRQLPVQGLLMSHSERRGLWVPLPSWHEDLGIHSTSLVAAGEATLFSYEQPQLVSFLLLPFSLLRIAIACEIRIALHGKGAGV